MIKTTVTQPMTKFGNDASRRLYRCAAEAARKLEQRLSLGSSLTELFSSEISDLRMKLKDYCERLLFADPVEYGRKAEDLLWRKVYYDFFSRCKQSRKKFNESEYHRSALMSHLLAGIGFYHHLLLRIQTEFHINLEGKVDSPLLWHLRGVKKERWKKYQLSGATDENVKTWAVQTSHRLLIYLGDLERYIAELNEVENHHLSERYYQQAFCINSQNGTPQNQLGSLYSNKFEAAYHYMRCLVCKEKFDGTEGNLLRVFEKNEEVLLQLYSIECDNTQTLKRSRFLSRFLKLCQIFYFKTPENFSCEMYCLDIVEEFDLTLNSDIFEDDAAADENEAFLSHHLTFKVVIMTLMCIWKLQEKGQFDASVATGFCLALFSYVVRGTTKKLISSLLKLKTTEKLQNGVEMDGGNKSSKQFSFSKEHLSDTSEEIDPNRDILLKKMANRKGFKNFSTRRLHRLRRRRKMSSTSQEDSELSEGEMTDLPESDEDVINSDASQAGSCSSDSLSEDEDDVLLEEESTLSNEGDSLVRNGPVLTNGTCTLSTNGDSKEELPIMNGKRNSFADIDSILDDPELPAEKLVKILRETGLLPCLKILTDWLRVNEDVLSACAESSHFILSCWIQILNILLKMEDKLLNWNRDELLKFVGSNEAWVQTDPLPEDTNLQSFPLLKNVHCLLLFDVDNRRELTPIAEVYLRVKCLLSFGRCLMRASESSVDFDPEKKKYYFNFSNKARDYSKDSNHGKYAKHNTDSQKRNVMKNMAHLWLKSELNNLEKDVPGGSLTELAPFLVADASVLCSHLQAVKQLVNAKRFLIVVPSVVIASLDNLKKESVAAREATRYLEGELTKGSRYIRAQKEIEKTSLKLMKYPKKKDKEAWDFFQILECCNYLVQKNSNGKPNLVTLLVGSLNHFPDHAVAMSNSIDVTMEKMESFLSKWRNSSKSPG